MVATSDGRRQATIRDVARLAGVATSTVSRAFSQPDRVHPATRERIAQAAETVHYVANSQARSLASGRTGSVALLVPDVTNPYYFDVIRGCQSQLKAAGYSQLLVDTEESGYLEASTLEQLRTRVDGVVLAGTRLTDDEVHAAAAQLPIVTINRAIPSVPTVVLDSAAGVDQLVHHLVSLGHRSIGYVAGPPRSWSNARRREAVRSAGRRLKVAIVDVGSFDPKLTSGAAAADAALNLQVSACIAFNDLLAIGMLNRLAQRGIDVPEQISVGGCDDIFGADFCSPPLTTVTGSQEQAGRSAITLLLNHLSGATARGSAAATASEAAAPKVVLPTHLTIRSSTGPAPGSDVSTTGARP